jgi:DNA modification methylase
MPRIENIGSATLYLGDCRDIVPTLVGIDACVGDPPYGIKEARGRNAFRKKVGTTPHAVPGKIIPSRDYGNDGWDDEPLDEETMAMLRGCAKHCILFGGNYYSHPPSKCWLVWDKMNGNSSFADCELAWTNMDKAVRRLRHMWNGMCREGMEPRGFHPTQKPLNVMAWCIENLPPGCDTILDPLMGSGTTGVAAIRLGRKFVGVELKEKYFDVACQRIEDEVRQSNMFATGTFSNGQQVKT